MTESIKRSVPIPNNVPLPELDERYFAYAAQLESPLNKLAMDPQLFIGKEASSGLTSLSETYSLVFCIPWLFTEAFPPVSEADLLDITDAGTLLFMALLLQDHYLDGQLPSYPEIPLLHQRLRADALQKFRALFEPQSSFWLCFERYFRQYTFALLQEMSHCGQVVTYPLETMWKIGCGKSALFKAVASAVAIKAGAEGHITYLEDSIDALAAAMQLSDDVLDWRDDYQRQNYTFPLTQVIPLDQWPTPSLSLAEIEEQLENSVILEKSLKQALEWFQQALAAVDDLNCPNWVEYVEDNLAYVRRYQRSFVVSKLLKVIS